MAIQGFKCDYCEVFSRKEGEVLEHEKNCNYDVAQKRCPTCAFHEIWDGEGSCADWVKNNADWVDNVGEEWDVHTVMATDYQGFEPTMGKKCIYWEKEKGEKINEVV